jgi:hypothetical protein
MEEDLGDKAHTGNSKKVLDWPLEIHMEGNY